jgi:hypothetical protein
MPLMPKGDGTPASTSSASRSTIRIVIGSGPLPMDEPCAEIICSSLPSGKFSMPADGGISTVSSATRTGIPLGRSSTNAYVAIAGGEHGVTD